MRSECAKFIFLIACCTTFCQYAVTQPHERNNAGDDCDLPPWSDEEEEASALASKPNGGSGSAAGDEAAAASQDDGPRAEDGVKISLPNGHVAVIITSEAPASQNQAEGFSGAPDGISPVADCSQAPVCPTAASATGQNSNESDADPLQENTAASAGAGDQSVETDKALASDPGTSGATGVKPVADEDGAQDVHTGEASDVPDVLGPQTPHLQDPGEAAVGGVEVGATALQEGPGWQAEASFDFNTSGDCSESSAYEDAFQPGLGPYDEKDYTKLALQRPLRNGTLRRAQSDDVGDEEGDGHDHTLIKGADTSSSPAPVQNHGAGFEVTPFVSEQPEPAEVDDAESSGLFIDLAAQQRLRKEQTSEEGQEGTNTFSFPSTWTPAVIAQEGVPNGQQAESDHHADIDLQSPDALQGSLASFQDIDLHGNQDVPAQSTADGIGHVDGNFHSDRQAESDVDISLHYNDPRLVFDARQAYMVLCFHSVFWAIAIHLLWYRRSG